MKREGGSGGRRAWGTCSGGGGEVQCVGSASMLHLALDLLAVAVAVAMPCRGGLAT